LRAYHYPIIGALVLVGCGGCGAIGPPIPPEDVGIAAKLLREEKRAAEEDRKRKTQEPEKIPEDEVTLPPLRPIGER
jgi:hypothetical protein